MSSPAPVVESLHRAVVYARVSTKEQAERGGDPDGYSIPAQREACRRKAESLGAGVVDEFVDRGESARSADRSELQRMLRFIKTERIDFVIVHKLDRLARNRGDDVAISAAITASGAKLISVTENIDETPSGHLMHGIMSSIAEFYSRNLAHEVVKGTQQKVRAGGTPTKAPIGYLNVRKEIEGQSEPLRTVELDPQRHELVRWAFSAYASGDWTLRTLATELEARGLTFRATPKQPARPVPANKLHEILRNRYYIGYVSYRGVEYEGKHPKLVDDETFKAVQLVLETHRLSGERSYRRDSYLAGTLTCARCESRLLYGVSRGRNGQEYGYFFCGGRHGRTTNCNLRYLPQQAVEEAVAAYWLTEVANEDRALIRQQLLLDLADHDESVSIKEQQLKQRIHAVKRERMKWAEKAMAGVVPDDIAREKQQQLGRQLLQAEADLARLTRAGTLHKEAIDAALDMLEHCGRAYQVVDDKLRRAYNQAWFKFLEIDEEEDRIVVSRAEHPDLVQAIRTAQLRPVSADPANEKRGSRDDYRVLGTVDGSNVACLVVLRGQLTNPAPALRAALRCYRKTGARPRSVARPHRTAAKPVRHLTSAEIDDLAASYQAGATVYELSARFGIHRNTVSRHLQALGTRMRNQSPSAGEIDAAVQLYGEGKSLVQVGRELGYDHKAIHRVLRGAGVAMRDTHGRKRPVPTTQ